MICVNWLMYVKLCMIWYDMIWYDMIWYDMKGYMLYDTSRYKLIWAEMIRLYMTWLDMMYWYDLWYIILQYPDNAIRYTVLEHDDAQFIGRLCFMRCDMMIWFYLRKPELPQGGPGRLTWNLQITRLERTMMFQTSMIMFHVNLQGCI